MINKESYLVEPRQLSIERTLGGPRCPWNEANPLITMRWNRISARFSLFLPLFHAFTTSFSSPLIYTYRSNVNVINIIITCIRTGGYAHTCTNYISVVICAQSRQIARSTLGRTLCVSSIFHPPQRNTLRKSTSHAYTTEIHVIIIP